MPEFSIDRHSFGVTWGGPKDRPWYYWQVFFWERRPQEEIVCPSTGDVTMMHRFAFERFWYDGPHAQLKLWRVTFSWQTPYTLPPYEYLNEKYQAKWDRKPRWWRRLWSMEAYEATKQPA